MYKVIYDGNKWKCKKSGALQASTTGEYAKVANEALRLASKNNTHVEFYNKKNRLSRRVY